MAEIKLQKRYIVSVSGCFIYIQIIFAAVIMGLLLWEAVRLEDKNVAENYRHYIINGEEFTLLVSCVCIVTNIIYLLIFCLSCHSGPCVGCPCLTLAGFYNVLMILAWFAAGGVEVYAAVQFKNQLSFDVLGITIKIPSEQLEELFRRRAAAAAFCFANGLTYMVSLQQVKYQDL